MAARTREESRSPEWTAEPATSLRKQRFAEAVTTASQRRGISLRALCEMLDIQSGTMTKYTKAEIDPWSTKAKIQGLLAEALGVSFDALMNFYTTGEFVAGVTLSSVESWISQEAAPEDSAKILKALAAMHERSTVKTTELYSWPRQVLETSPFDRSTLEVKGVTDEKISAVERGGDDDGTMARVIAHILNKSQEEVSEVLAQRKEIS